MKKKQIQKAKGKRQKEYEILSEMEDFFIRSFDPEAKFAEFARNFIDENMRRDGSEQDATEGFVDPLLSMGFLIGQMFEVTDPEIRRQIELMKELIREKGLLSCIPRETERRAL